MNFQFVKSFNVVSERFFNKLLLMFPKNDKILITKTKFNTSKQIDISGPVKIFYELLYESGEYIMNKDIVHFKKNNKFDNQFGILENWNTYSEEDKNILWEYIQSLYILCMKAQYKDDELLKHINNTKIEN